ncbi:MAG TPA: hypothetical protein VG711_10875, partial [Phycisphaerales bacterium]|nr:hypothetical protein [Phycisphaerales bacterium]
FANVAQEGGKITDQVNTALSVNEGQPLPDYESARSILTAVLNQWANELADLVRSGRQISERTDLDQAVMYSARAMFNPATLDPMTQQLATTADTLKHLPELDVSAVTRQLARGEALLVMSPTRSVIIPSNQLFPKSNVRVRGHGGITYDQRFNGEQLIASAMQSLLVKTMPRVVFVHGEERSILAADSNRIDARAMSLVLKTARYKVSEWNAGKDQSRPKFDDDAPVVWVVIPPQARKTLDATPGERALLAGVKGLIDDGESVLLSFHPSLLPKYGQPDPWVALTKGLGFTPQTQNIVVERQVVAEDQTETQRGLALVSYPTEHPISLSLQDQVSYFALPVPLAVDANLPAQERMQKLIEIAPTRERWLDKDWLNTPNGKNDGPTASMSSLDKTATAAVAIERPNPLGRGEQRIEAVGSGSWMLSFISDVAVNDAGDRMVLAYPGNQQLMLSSVAWLSGHDELIGASTSGREVAQLNGVTAEAQHTWTWIVVGILPAGVVLAGLGAWLVRRL